MFRDGSPVWLARLGMTPVLVYTLLTALPYVAVTVRRLHDTAVFVRVE